MSGQEDSHNPEDDTAERETWEEELVNSTNNSTGPNARSHTDIGEEEGEEEEEEREDEADVLDPSDLVETDLFQGLANGIRRERGTPDLLPFLAALVAEVSSKIEEQTALVSALSGDPLQDSARQCYELNIRRFRFLLASYHRSRIAKIDRYGAAILDSSELQQRCSHPELKYCIGQFVSKGRCLKDVVLKRLPTELQSLTQQSQLSPGMDMVGTPPLDGYVFVKLLRDAGHVPVEDSGSNMVLMEAGDIYVKSTVT
eukprot:CAMPEP_0175040472 /NCGR_PEP_ID=MMETSP0052_2-20121109/1284_1 /TAXON_ID=51329 ORGANISM="Polytomella parva, Strain SAG 63-3" /NCGR_SAMPLE_ID=MMETSP0052_2 /ASSEMBLY_ACC=CAM_ASM_000194 /LENGTH=256 /DNA_ID=CAMNT_0016302691 /DNA_START=203 /DNA_END=974 /DNA_ORIENTATION=+